MNFCHSVILLLPFIGLTMTQEYVNSDPASYQFSYNTGDSGPAKMFREEQRAASGQVTGKYGYVDPYGHMRIVQYEAGPQGFIARGDVGPDREAMRIARQLADQDYQEKLPILQQWNAVAARLSAGPSFPAWPAPVVPSTSSVGSSSSSSSSSSGNALVPPSPSSVERARLTASNQAAWAPATGSAHSFTNHVNHYTSNINSVWPTGSAVVGRSAPLLAAPQPATNYFNGAPQTWFTMSSHGSNPYNIAYSY